MKFFIHLFFKNPNYKDAKTREQLGVFSSLTGIVLNVSLSLMKFIVGTISGSIAIVSDSFNNLSDSASNIIAIIGYKLANKPADKDHPFGHGRIEYLTSLAIGVTIILVAIGLFKSSIEKILNPTPLYFSWWILLVLVVSIGVKIWMAFFNRYLGQQCNSSVMISVYKDSFNDVIATSATLIAYILSPFTNLPVDGFMGIVVSCFVLFAGYGVVKDTVDSLLGAPVDAELVDEITQIIKANPIVLGMHDLLLHSYGPMKVIGSVHVEVDASDNVLTVHDAVDEIEREVHDKLGVIFTIHTDPIILGDQYINECHSRVDAILKSIDSRMTFHDLRVVKGPTHTNLIFDIVLPFDVKMTKAQIKDYIDEYLNDGEIQYYTVITFDHEYN